MAAVKSDLQKLENLLKSATNERQRKMYQSLLDKARQGFLHQKSTAHSSQAAGSKVDTVTIVASTDNQKPKEQATKQVLSEADASALKTEKNTNSGDKPDDIIASQPPAELKEVAPNRAKRKKSNRQSHTNKSTIFQAVGLIRCTPEIKEEKLCITIDGQPYELKRGERRPSRQYFDKLKQEIEQNGSRELWLRVYPKIVHDSKKQEIRHWFILVKVFYDQFQCQSQREDFIFRGIWQYVAYCSDPVISICRNIDNLKFYQRLSPPAKKAFIRSLAFPMIWSAPVEPSHYNPELDYDQQMPRYFVQVRAVFKDGQFKVIEEIEKPTLNIPKYIKPLRKNTKEVEQ